MNGILDRHDLQVIDVKDPVVVASADGPAGYDAETPALGGQAAR